jgi:hypothetical protein
MGLGSLKKSMTLMLEKIHEQDYCDHADPGINNMIQLLRKPHESRITSDLLEISKEIKDLKFFKE